MEGNQYFVYLLQSEVDGSFYIGYTAKRPTERLAEHNQGKTTYTRRKRPWRLVYAESFLDKRVAMQREKQLKRCKNSAYIRKYILK